MTYVHSPFTYGGERRTTLLTTETDRVEERGVEPTHGDEG